MWACAFASASVPQLNTTILGGVGWGGVMWVWLGPKAQGAGHLDTAEHAHQTSPSYLHVEELCKQPRQPVGKANVQMGGSAEPQAHRDLILLKRQEHASHVSICSRFGAPLSHSLSLSHSHSLSLSLSVSHSHSHSHSHSLSLSISLSLSLYLPCSSCFGPPIRTKNKKSCVF